MKEISINTEMIKLDALLKWGSLVSMGSEAKFYITNEAVKLNGEVETRRGKKVFKGDVIEFQGEEYKIV